MIQNFIWIHEDALSLEHPVFEAAGEGAKVFFIWDAAYFEQNAYSLKRLAFLYDGLIDLDIDVYAGETQTTLRRLCAGGVLFMPDTPNMHFLSIAKSVQDEMRVVSIENTPFIEPPDDVDMTRFFRFWNRSRKSALGDKSALRDKSALGDNA